MIKFRRLSPEFNDFTNSKCFHSVLLYGFPQANPISINICMLICTSVALLNHYFLIWGVFFLQSILYIHCLRSRIKSSIYFLLALYFLEPVAKLVGMTSWNDKKKKNTLLFDQIFQAGWEEVWKWLTNAWFVHCLKATEIFHHCSISIPAPHIPLNGWNSFRNAKTYQVNV